MGEDVLLAIIVLSHDDLFGPEEGSKVSVEVLFLLVADRIVADPQILRIGLEAYVKESEGEEEEEGDGAGNYEYSVIKVEPGQFLEDDLKVHAIDQ